jgi:archaellum component FlaC
MAEEEKDKIDQVLDELRSIKKKQQEDGVKLEKLGSDIKAVAEGHEVIRREIQGAKSELKADIKLVDGKIDKTLDDHVRLPAHADVSDKLDKHLLVPHAV